MPFVDLESSSRRYFRPGLNRCDELVGVRVIHRKRTAHDVSRESMMITMYRDAMASLRIKDGDRVGFRMDHQTLDLMIYNTSGMLTTQHGKRVRIRKDIAPGTHPTHGVVELSFAIINNPDSCRRIVEALTGPTKFLPFNSYTSSRDGVRSAVVIRLTDQSVMV